MNAPQSQLARSFDSPRQHIRRAVSETGSLLHELIQNADDNAYEPASVPSLSIIYGNRALQLSCNERGFSRRNVEALCKIGSSTKGGKAKSHGYTREKGVGFKSVFKVARVVWIRSGHYSFKFVKAEHARHVDPYLGRVPYQLRPSENHDSLGDDARTQRR